MSKDIDKEIVEQPDDAAAERQENQEQEQADVAEMEVNDQEETDEAADTAGEAGEIEKLRAEVQESKDKYLRLYSEFENFRRRTAKEKLDLIKTANQDLMTALIPVIDDFERAQKALEESEDHTTSKEGFELIYNKFNNILKQKGLKAMQDETGSEFNTEFHEAISQVPVDKRDLKGKIIDVVEKGYYLDDKVIRFAKVVLGA
ncbi:MAG: nucleotide exchange factor GrpE [Cyclobacteriaceae bacterium]|nr:nucleotide exchange factor GrpE [Cyclobacteriaceae bacterium]